MSELSCRYLVRDKVKTNFLQTKDYRLSQRTLNPILILQNSELPQPHFASTLYHDINYLTLKKMWPSTTGFSISQQNWAVGFMSLVESLSWLMLWSSCTRLMGYQMSVSTNSTQSEINYPGLTRAILQATTITDCSKNRRGAQHLSARELQGYCPFIRQEKHMVLKLSPLPPCPSLLSVVSGPTVKVAHCRRMGVHMILVINCMKCALLLRRSPAQIIGPKRFEYYIIVALRSEGRPEERHTMIYQYL